MIKKENFKKMLIYSYLFIFIIINSMLPNKTNTQKLSDLKTIIPGIEKVYSSEEDINNEDNNYYSIKIFEIIHNLF